VAVPIVLAIGLGALVIVVIATLLGLYLFRDSIFPPSVVTYPVGDSPRAILGNTGTIWIANGFGNSVAALDTAACPTDASACGQTLGTYPVDDLPVGLAIEGDHLWVASALNRKLTALNRSNGEVVGVYQLSSVPSTLLYAHGDLWTANEIASTVTQIGVDGTIIGDYAIEGGPVVLTASPKAIFVAAKEGQTLYQLDPVNGQVLNTVAVAGKPIALAYAEQGLWVGYDDQPELDLINADGSIQKVALTAPVVALYADGQRVWATLKNSTLVAVSPQLKIVVTQSLVFKPYTLTTTTCGPACVDVWILSEAADSVNRIRVTK
jgi:outer membrane protein assembly factor BamB